MVFSSMTFLYVFLPLVVISYFLCKNIVYRNSVLLIFSLVFYSWGEPRFIIGMVLAALAAYVGGIVIDKYRDNTKIKKAAFIITVALLCGNLVYFKYLNFILDSIESLLKTSFNIGDVVLPIGISFYTFQILSYVIDLYKGTVKLQKNYFYLLLYVSFFPQLIAGPIVRYETVEKEIGERQETIEDFAKGLRRFCVGLSKKVIIANSVATIPLIIYSKDASVMGSAMYFVAAIGYALQIYFDFSGYSDMAIGLGRMFGFHFMENFNYPYIATSVTDFWRRWHMSLSTWFRDYIYIPMGGNRVKKGRFVLNIVFVWALTGIWHGASWNFMLWGVYYGAILLLEKLVLKKYIDKLPKIVSWAYTMFIVLIGWVIFNVTDFSQMGKTLKIMFSFMPTNWAEAYAFDAEILLGFIYIPLGILCMLPWKTWLKVPQTKLWDNISYALSFVLFVLCVMFTISSTYNPFIYFRF